MTLLTLIAALLLEQARAFAERSRVLGWLEVYGHWLEGRFNDGQHKHGVAAWLLGVLVPAILLGGAVSLLMVYQPVLGFLGAVGVLYVTAGFRQVSHHFTDIHLALRMGELDRARSLLAEWLGQGSDLWSSAEVARLAIENALLAAYRHVFAPMFWYAVLGPAGALLYWLAHFFGEKWGRESDPELREFGVFAKKALRVLDWLPSRLTAVTFAVAGDFEDAVFCWRNQASRTGDDCSGILLASGAGALSLKLGGPVRGEIGVTDRPEFGLGDEADADYMQSTVGLIWRALLVGLFLLALIWVAGRVS